MKTNHHAIIVSMNMLVICCSSGKSGPPEDGITDCCIDTEIIRELDLLLILHTAYYQNDYLSTISTYLPEALIGPLLDADIDVRVGLLSTDLGSAGYVFDDYPGPACGMPCDRTDGTSSSDNGQLTAWPPCWPEGPIPPWWSSGEPEGCGPFVLDDPGSWPTYVNGNDIRFHDWLMCFLNRADGCFVSQPLESLYQALEPERNEGFFREEAVLAVLILTALDDCSISDPSVFQEDGVVVPVGSYSKCAYFPEYLFPVTRYSERLMEFKPKEKLVVAVFAGPDTEYQWCTDLNPGLCPCEENHPCLLNGSCTADIVYPSPRLHEFANSLGTTDRGTEVGFSEESCPLFTGIGGNPMEPLGRFKELIFDKFQ